MKTLIALILSVMMLPTLANHAQGGRQYQSIATVDTRTWRSTPYLLFVIEYDTEAEIAVACNAPPASFTRRGCTLSAMIKGVMMYQVIVLSNDYVALRHELRHVTYGPCHVNAGGATPLRCQQWLIDNNLKPIGNQVITIKEEKNA